jgi:putative oxidoreductase
MKMNYPMLSRSLIALLFVVAGVKKILGFAMITTFIGSLIGMTGTVAMIVTLLVIVVEVPVALAYAGGYRVCYTGGILIAFTVIATLLVHNNIADDNQLIMALKNIAIIGGILATTGVCSCDRCKVELKNA